MFPSCQQLLRRLGATVQFISFLSILHFFHLKTLNTPNQCVVWNWGTVCVCTNTAAKKSVWYIEMRLTTTGLSVFFLTMSLRPQITAMSQATRMREANEALDSMRNHPSSWNHWGFSPSSHPLSQNLHRCTHIHPSSKNWAADNNQSPLVHGSSMTDCSNKLVLPERNLSFSQ